MGKDSSPDSRVRLGEDGKYRWTYELNLIKSPEIFLLVWKIFFFIFLGIFSFSMLFSFLGDRFYKESVINDLKIFGIVFLCMTGLVLVGYLIYAALMGWKYIIEFEMDEKGINHKQTDFQAERAKKIGKAARFAGAAAGNIGAINAGRSIRTEMYSDFKAVKKVKAYKNRHLIKVNGLLQHNRVYVRSDNFEFVKNYIVSHCENANKD